MAVLLLLGAGPDHAIELTVHSCHRSANGARPVGSAKAEIDRLTDELADRLDVPAGQEMAQQHEANRLLSNASADIAGAVTRLSDDELDRLIVLLPILCFAKSILNRWKPATVCSTESHRNLASICAIGGCRM